MRYDPANPRSMPGHLLCIMQDLEHVNFSMIHKKRRHFPAISYYFYFEKYRKGLKGQNPQHEDIKIRAVNDGGNSAKITPNTKTSNLETGCYLLRLGGVNLALRIFPRPMIDLLKGGAIHQPFSHLTKVDRAFLQGRDISVPQGRTINPPGKTGSTFKLDTECKRRTDLDDSLDQNLAKRQKMTTGEAPKQSGSRIVSNPAFIVHPPGIGERSAYELVQVQYLQSTKYSNVFLATHWGLDSVEYKTVDVKDSMQSSPGHADLWQAERDILVQLDHPGIKKLLFSDARFHRMVLEVVNGFKLHDFIDETTGMTKLTKRQAIRFIIYFATIML